MGAGTGLGLSICHNIVTRMDGEIAVTSHVDGGTTFRVSLPPAPVQQLSPSEPPTPRAGVERRGRVMVVDDEPVIGVILRRILVGHDVTAFTTVEEALAELASGKRFDVIFSDLMMPQRTGMDFYRELTRLAPDDAARVVFVTGGAFTKAASEFLEGVGNERVEKPFTPKIVRDLVQQILGA